MQPEEECSLPDKMSELNVLVIYLLFTLERNTLCCKFRHNGSIVPILS